MQNGDEVYSGDLESLQYTRTKALRTQAEVSWRRLEVTVSRLFEDAKAFILICWHAPDVILKGSSSGFLAAMEAGAGARWGIPAAVQSP